VRLVGADAEGESLAVKSVEHAANTRVKACALRPALCVGGEEVLVHFVHQCVGRIAANAALDQHAAAIAHAFPDAFE